MDRSLIERIVAEVVRRLRLLEGGEPSPEVEPPVRLVTEEMVIDAVGGGAEEIRVLSGAVVTPLARDALRREGIRLAEVGDEEAGAGPAVERRSKAIALGANARGYALKETLKEALQGGGQEVVDCGGFSPQEGAALEVAEKVATCVAEGTCGTGIVVDGGGGPSAIVANKVTGVRAVACHDVTSARTARAHVDANVLCLGVGAVGDTVAQEIVATWLTTPFEGGEYAARVRKIGEVEQRQQGA